MSGWLGEGFRVKWRCCCFVSVIGVEFVEENSKFCIGVARWVLVFG